MLLVIYQVIVDVDGIVRGQGRLWHIGCHESSAGHKTLVYLQSFVIVFAALASRRELCSTLSLVDVHCVQRSH